MSKSLPALYTVDGMYTRKIKQTPSTCMVNYNQKNNRIYRESFANNDDEDEEDEDDEEEEEEQPSKKVLSDNNISILQRNLAQLPSDKRQKAIDNIMKITSDVAPARIPEVAKQNISTKLKAPARIPEVAKQNTTTKLKAPVSVTKASGIPSKPPANTKSVTSVVPNILPEMKTQATAQITDILLQLSPEHRKMVTDISQKINSISNDNTPAGHAKAKEIILQMYPLLTNAITEGLKSKSPEILAMISSIPDKDAHAFLKNIPQLLMNSNSGKL